MASHDRESRTEKPTPRRISEAKRKGTVPRSADFGSAVMIAIGILILATAGGYMTSFIRGASVRWWGEAGTFQLTNESVYRLLLDASLVIGAVLLPFFFILILSAFLVNHIQEPITMSWERFAVGLDKIDPVNGLKRLFSRDSLVEGIKAFVKILIIGYVSWRVLKDEVIGSVYLSQSDVPSIVDYVTHLVFRLVMNCAGTLLVLSFIDLLYVKWRFHENLKMTKEEVKEEHRQTEGDPRIRGKIRQAQLAAARRRIRVVIPTADVVVTNPTHYAVALKYDRETMSAPVVVLKGVDHLARRMREVAREFGVTTVENRFLARELYDQVDEGEEIPEKFYAAVAEILAYVYGLKGKG